MVKSPGFLSNYNIICPKEAFIFTANFIRMVLPLSLKILTPLLVLFTCLVFAGCEGTDSREKVDDTVKELSGQKNIERFDQMKKDIDKINKQQADRLKEPK